MHGLLGNLTWIRRSRLMQPVPQPQPTPEAANTEAVEIAAGLDDIYGDQALASARAALQLARKTAVPDHVELW